METNYPLTAEVAPLIASGERLSRLMPKVLWRKLRELTLNLCDRKCQICHADDTKLSLHEDWEYCWHPEMQFDIDGWERYAADKGWPAYEKDRQFYSVNGKKVGLQAMYRREEEHRDAQVASGFTPYVSERGKLRYADEENLNPYQTLVGFLMLCGHCHSAKNIDKICRLADAGKLEIEPVLQHYMRVNGIDRKTALSQWSDARRDAPYLTHVINSDDPLIKWVTKVQEYDGQGNRAGFTPLNDWIDCVKLEGVETISPFLFRHITTMEQIREPS